MYLLCPPNQHKIVIVFHIYFLIVFIVMYSTNKSLRAAFYLEDCYQCYNQCLECIQFRYVSLTTLRRFSLRFAFIIYSLARIIAYAMLLQFRSQLLVFHGPSLSRRSYKSFFTLPYLYIISMNIFVSSLKVVILHKIYPKYFVLLMNFYERKNYCFVAFIIMMFCNVLVQCSYLIGFTPTYFSYCFITISNG